MARSLEKPTCSASHRTWPPINSAAAAKPALNSAKSAAYSGDVDKVLSHLKPRERELVWLAYAEGSSHREIATVIGCKEASVRPMLHRARQSLMAALKRFGLHERMMV
jgi:RNA polymerase sigma factor (sigma-70 family)